MSLSSRPPRCAAVAAIGATVLALAPSAATAATQSLAVTSQFVVASSCSTSTTANMDFGALPATLSVAQADATGTISITCTIGAPYTLGGSGGANGSGSQNRLYHNNGGTATYLNYNVYWDSNRTQARATSTLSATGTGAAQTVTIYGRIPAQTATSAGAYSDTFTLSITY